MLLLREARTKEFRVLEVRSRQDEVDLGRKATLSTSLAPQVQVIQAAAQQVSPLTVSERDPEEQVYIWMLTQLSKHIPWIQGQLSLRAHQAAWRTTW